MLAVLIRLKNNRRNQNLARCRRLMLIELTRDERSGCEPTGEYLWEKERRRERNRDEGGATMW